MSVQLTDIFVYLLKISFMENFETLLDYRDELLNYIDGRNCYLRSSSLKDSDEMSQGEISELLDKIYSNNIKLIDSIDNFTANFEYDGLTESFYDCFECIGKALVQCKNYLSDDKNSIEYRKLIDSIDTELFAINKKYNTES